MKQVTAVAFSDGADKVFSGGIDNEIKVWDLRKNEVSMKLQGHTETITSMQLSPDGSYLLTNSMDCTLRVWDMRPYAPQVHCFVLCINDLVLWVSAILFFFRFLVVA